MNNNISNNIKVLRKRRRLSQAGLGIAVGFSRSKISNWEIGRRAITIEEAMILADYFKITLDELVREKFE